MPLASRPGSGQPPPWWRRLLGWRNRDLPYAGQRPRLSRGQGRLVGWLSLAVIAGVAAFAAHAWAGTVVTNVEDHFAHPSIVFPSKVTASREDPGHPAANLHDGYDNTWWGTGESGDGSGVHVDATFAQPVNLLDIVITPGAGVEQDAFTAQSRPQTAEVTLVRPDGSRTSSTVTFPDSPGPIIFAIHGQGIVRARLTLQSAYLARSGHGTEVAIAEAEFFARR